MRRQARNAVRKMQDLTPMQRIALAKRLEENHALLKVHKERDKTRKRRRQ